MNGKRPLVLALLLVPALAGALETGLGLTAWGGYALNVQGASLPSVEVSSQSLSRWAPAGAAMTIQAGIVTVEMGVGADLVRHVTQTETISGAASTLLDAGAGSRYFVVIGVALGWPIPVGTAVLTPRVGIEGDFAFAARDAAGGDLLAGMTATQRQELTEGWFTAGASLSVPLGGAFRLEPWLQFGYKLPSDGEATVVKNLRSAGFEPLLLGLRATAGATIRFSL
jgi:hypothetical protein